MRFTLCWPRAFSIKRRWGRKLKVNQHRQSRRNRRNRPNTQRRPLPSSRSLTNSTTSSTKYRISLPRTVEALWCLSAQQKEELCFRGSLSTSRTYHRPTRRPVVHSSLFASERPATLAKSGTKKRRSDGWNRATRGRCRCMGNGVSLPRTVRTL